MLIRDMDWSAVETQVLKDDRCVLPLGSTEQHSSLSLATDTILAERVAAEAAAPFGVPVYPALPFGVAPYFQTFPGSVSLRVETYARVVREVLESVIRTGFRRVLVVNGHGGNSAAAAVAEETMLDHPLCRIRWFDWFRAPAVLAAAQAVDPRIGHGNWFENFPWTRLPGLAPPDWAKPMVDREAMKTRSLTEQRAMLGDGSYGGPWQREDREMQRIWEAGVAATREAIERW